MWAAAGDRWRRAGPARAAGAADLVGGAAVVAGRVADVVAEAVEQAVQIAGRVAGGVLVGPGRFVLGGEVLRGGRVLGGGWRPLGLLGPRAAPAEAEVLPELLAVVLPELAELLGQFGQPLAHPSRPVAAGEVILHLLLYALGDALHLLLRLLPGPVLGLLGLAAGSLGLLAGAAALVLGAPGLLLPLLLDAAHLLLGGAPRLLVGVLREVPEGTVVFAGAFLGATAPAGLGRGSPHLAPQITRRAAHIGPDLGGELGDRVADLQLQVGQFTAAVGQLGAARVRDGVHLAPALGGVGDQALRLQLGQPGVDGARRGGV